MVLVATASYLNMFNTVVAATCHPRFNVDLSMVEDSEVLMVSATNMFLAAAASHCQTEDRMLRHLEEQLKASQMPVMCF